MPHEATNKIMKLGNPIYPMLDPALFWKRVRETNNVCVAANMPFPAEQKLLIAEK